MNIKNSNEYKYKHWVMTVLSPKDGDLPEVLAMIGMFRNLCKEYTFQLEEADTGMLHYQCTFVTKIRKRQQTILNDVRAELGINIKYIEIDRAQDYETAIDYCMDRGKRMEGTVVVSNVAKAVYQDGDIKFLDNREVWHPWQISFMALFFNESETAYEAPDDRSVYWITDTAGNSGKSKFSKWLFCRYPNNTKITFGTAAQLRAAVVEKGPKQMYILDIPRTLAEEDSIQTVISVIEDLKNGYIETVMHGNPRTLLMDPPHVIVISNVLCPTNLLSTDRWKEYSITATKQLYCHGKRTAAFEWLSSVPKN